MIGNDFFHQNVVAQVHNNVNGQSIATNLLGQIFGNTPYNTGIVPPWMNGQQPVPEGQNGPNKPTLDSNPWYSTIWCKLGITSAIIIICIIIKKLIK